MGLIVKKNANIGQGKARSFHAATARGCGLTEREFGYRAKPIPFTRASSSLLTVNADILLPRFMCISFNIALEDVFEK